MGRKDNSGQEEYIQKEKSFIEINTNTNTNTEAQNDVFVPGTNIINREVITSTTRYMTDQSNRQISRSNSIISMKESEDDLELTRKTGINEVFPKADKQIKAAKTQKTALESTYDTAYTFGVTDSFSTIHKEDGKYMRKIKGLMAEYQRTHGIYEQKDILDSLISACRWYNASHWSYFGEGGRRLRDVKTILDKAKKERRDVVSAINEEEKARVQRRENRDRIADRLHDNENLIVRKRANEESKYFGDVTDQRPVIMSKLWAGLKAYTVGLFGRNILNLGMGAIAGTAWLASYPVARLIGAATGKSEYKKGFNIRIPHPQSPKAWMKYYMYNRRHVGNVINRYFNRKWMWIFVIPGKFIQYDIWDPFKHLITFDVNHLSGGAYFGKDTKREAIMKRADEDYRSAVAPADDEYESEDDVFDEYSSSEEQTISDRIMKEKERKEQLKDPVMSHYAENVLA